MAESLKSNILGDIKSLLGIQSSDTSFDPALIIFINSALASLVQMGVCSSSNLETGFSITDDTAVWSDFVDSDNRLSMIKSYVYLKVKLDFDPPVNQSLIESYRNSLKEYEYRLYIQKGS